MLKYLSLIVFLICIACQKENSNENIKIGSKNIPSPGNNPPSTCKEQWEKWHERYTASSYLAAFNKNSFWKIDENSVKSVISGAKTIQFSPPYEFFNKELSKLELSGERGPGKDSERDRAIVKNMDTVYAKVTPPQSLVFTLAGAKHIADYFFEKPRALFSYAFYPLDQKEVGLGTVEFQKCTRSIMGDFYENWYSPDKFVRGSIIGIFEALYDAVNKNQSSFPIQDLFLEAQSIKNNILIADLHGYSNTSIIDDLPPPECMKTLGFTSITLALETFPVSKSLTYNDLIIKLDKDDKKLCSKSIDNAYLLPIWRKLINYVDDSQKLGLNVSYVGIE